MNIRTIRRDDWYRVLEKDVLIRDFQWKEMTGKISLLRVMHRAYLCLPWKRNGILVII